MKHNQLVFNHDTGELGLRTGPCNVKDRNNPRFCVGMQKALRNQSPSHKGLPKKYYVEGNKTRFYAVVYRPHRSQEGLMLNWCPWCGNALDKWFA